MRLAACNGKRIEDMTREDLIEALEQMSDSYMAIARVQMNPSPVPTFDWSMARADELFMEIQNGALSKRCTDYGKRTGNADD